MNELLCEIDKIKVRDSDFECSKLLENYSRLRILKSLVLNCNILMIPFIRFMEKIDSVNQYYLKEINLDPEYYDSDSDIELSITSDSKQIKLPVYELHSLKNSVIIIKSSLEESLNCNDPVEKLELVLTAYNLMTTIVHVVRNDCYYDYEDEEEFSHEFKRRKF